MLVVKKPFCTRSTVNTKTLPLPRHLPQREIRVSFKFTFQATTFLVYPVRATKGENIITAHALSTYTTRKFIYRCLL